MHAARIYVVLALCWPTGSTGARDDSLHAQMELEVRGRHDEKATEREDLWVSLVSPPAAEPKTTPELTNNVSEATKHVSQNVSKFWQDTVPVWLGLGKHNETRCAESKKAEETSKNDNWLSRLYWCVPIMIPPLLLVSALPLLYWFSASAVRNDLQNGALSYAGFFIANWVMLYILNPESTPRKVFGTNLKYEKDGVGTVNYEPALMLVMVATCGLIFRVIATGQNEGLSCDNASATFKPADIYMNLNRSISDVMVRFIGQSFLMWYYCAALIERTESMLFSFCSVPRVQFVCIVLVALPCLQGVLRAALGKDFLTNIGSWKMLVYSREYKVEQKKGVKSWSDKLESSPIQNYMRAVMGFLVNQVYPGMILFTIHAMIFHLSYLDLTKTLFSVAFITKLDDEPDDVAQIHVIGDESDKEGEASIGDENDKEGEASVEK